MTSFLIRLIEKYDYGEVPQEEIMDALVELSERLDTLEAKEFPNA